MTSVRTGWSIPPYGREKFDVEVDLADLPLILAEHCADPEAAGRMPFSTQLEVIRLAAEIFSTNTRLRREIALARAAGATKATREITGVRDEAAGHEARLAKLLAPYQAAGPEPLG